MSTRTLAALAAVAALGLGAWLWGGPEPDPPAPPPPAPQAGVPPGLRSPFGGGAVVVGPDAAAPAVPAPAGVASAAAAVAGQAPGLGLAELRALQAQLSANGSQHDAADQMSRHLLFVDASLRLAHLHAHGGDPAELRGLAQLVDEGLDARLANGELAREQARELKRTVLQVLEPDPARRQQLLAAWLARQAPG